MASPRLVTLALVLIQVLFGMNYVISKVVVTAFPPLVWASIRIIISAAVMIAFAFAKRPEGFSKTIAEGRRYFVPLIGFSLLGMIINQGSFLVGLRHTTSTNSAILNTMIPVFTLLIVTLRGQEPLTLHRVIGFFCAFGGVLSIRHIENFSLSDQTLLGDALTLVNCLSYAIFLSTAKSFLESHDRIWTTAWMFVYGSVGLTVLALPSYAEFTLPIFTPTLIACMFFAVIGGTLLTYFLSLWALAQTKSSSVALYIYLQPIVASALAWVWFSEPVTLRTVLSGILIFAGMLLASDRTRAKPAR